MEFFEVENTINSSGLSRQCVIINGGKYYLPQVYDRRGGFNLDNEYDMRRAELLNSGKNGYYNLPPLSNGNVVLVDENNRYGLVDDVGNTLIPFIYHSLLPTSGQDDYFIAEMDESHINRKGDACFYKTILASDGTDLLDAKQNGIDYISDNGRGEVTIARQEDWKGLVNGGFGENQSVVQTDKLPLYHQKILLDRQISEMEKLRDEIISQLQEPNLEMGVAK